MHPDHLITDLKLTDGFGDTEAVVMALAPTMGRDAARGNVSAVCDAVAVGEGRLIDLLAPDPDVATLFDRAALKRLLGPANYLGSSGAMVDRVLAGAGR